MSSRTTPAAFLIHTIHAPGFGRIASTPENIPTTSKTAVIPNENTNRYTNPNVPLCVAATQVRTTANAGAPQGAATIPDVAPSRKTDGDDPPPRLPAHTPSRHATRDRHTPI